MAETNEARFLQPGDQVILNGEAYKVTSVEIEDWGRYCSVFAIVSAASLLSGETTTIRLDATADVELAPPPRTAQILYQRGSGELVLQDTETFDEITAVMTARGRAETSAGNTVRVFVIANRVAGFA